MTWPTTCYSYTDHVRPMHALGKHLYFSHFGDKLNTLRGIEMFLQRNTERFMAVDREILKFYKNQNKFFLVLKIL